MSHRTGRALAALCLLLTAFALAGAPLIGVPRLALAQTPPRADVTVEARAAGPGGTAPYEITVVLTLDLPLSVEILPTDELGPIGGAVRTVLPFQARPRGTHALTWDGTDDAGLPVAPGTYAVHAKVERAGTVRGTHVLLNVGGVAGVTAEASPVSQTGPCTELWINYAYNDLYGRNPNGTGDSGECNPNYYGGGPWNSYDELVARVKAAVESGATQVPMDPPARSTPPAAVASPRVTHRIRVVGDAACAEQVQVALDLLHHKAPSHYAVADRYVGVIECTETGDGMGVADNPPRYYVGSSTRNSGPIWFASTIAHDACHSRQYNDYRAANPNARVPDAVYLGRDAEAQCIAFQREALLLMDAPESFIEHVDTVLETEYWHDPNWGRGR
jgi:hypothetical protein